MEIILRLSRANWKWWCCGQCPNYMDNYLWTGITALW